MDINEMLEKLTLDLKMTLDSEISTAEATRCIERAVDVLSRKIPRERIYEHTWIEAVVDDTFTTPAATDVDKIVVAMDLSATVDGDTATLAITWMDIARPVLLTLTDADSSITRFTIIVKGTDIDGVYREERFYRHNGKVQTGKIYFYSIYEVEVSEIAGNGASDTLDIGTAAGAGIWVQLDNPVESDSESIYSGASKSGTKYILNTDYQMDYANGRINIISSGSMVEDTTYYASYDRAPTSIDISGIIPELIRIVKVIYPVNKIPEQSVAYNIWQDMLTITVLRQGTSQEALTNKNHLAIYYEARHAPPTLVGAGSYPSLLDEVVLVGAAGYALEVEALQHEHQAATDLASLRTELGLTTAIHVLIATALGKVTTYATDMDTALDAAIVQAAAASTALDKINNDSGRTYITDADGSLDSAAIAIAKVITYLEDNTSEDSKYWLTKITTDIAELRTKVIVAQDAVATYLGNVSTIDLDGGTPDSAVETLKKYENLINQLNDGSNVSELGASYSQSWSTIAQVRTQAALGYVQEATLRLSNLRTYIEQADSWGRIAQGFVSEAGQRIGEANVRLTIADRYIHEAMERTSSANSYINEATGRFNMIQAFIGEAGARLSEIAQHLEEAGIHKSAAESDMILSDRYRAESQMRLSEFHRILDNKAEYRKRIGSTAVRQPS